MAGPPASEEMYAAIAWVCATFSTRGLRAASASMSLSGIRPVLTWKSTAAAPTPIRLGPVPVPWAMKPWQLEQFCTNSCRPTAVSREATEGEDAEAGRALGGKCRVDDAYRDEPKQHHGISGGRPPAPRDDPAQWSPRLLVCALVVFGVRPLPC